MKNFFFLICSPGYTIKLKILKNQNKLSKEYTVRVKAQSVKYNLQRKIYFKFFNAIYMTEDKWFEKKKDKRQQLQNSIF